MEHFDTDLQGLVAKGKAQGYLTYDEVNQYLPDEAVTPEKLALQLQPGRTIQ